MSEVGMVRQNLEAYNLQIPSELLEKIHELVAPVKNWMWFEGKEENNL
jgi:L-galactose dehydrogenase